MNKIDMAKAFRKLGVESLNDMQKATAEAMKAGKGDVVVLSPTGTGKTLAYLLPLAEMINPDNDNVQAVVIVPGRELALQSQQVLADVGAVRGMACYGGRTAMEEHRALRQLRPQVVFATPGRLNDHLAKGNISANDVRLLVIDEFDKCLDMGFENEMRTALASLSYVQRRVLLSATNSPRIPLFVENAKLERINFVDEAEKVKERIAVYEVKSDSKDKLATLHRLLLAFNGESTIVFLNHRESVERTNAFLVEQGFVTSLFHGRLEQDAREAALYRFANGSANVLVCTDLASRGLDIDDVRHIVHYHLPETADAYTHRIGRTARWDKQGNGYFILSANERIPEYVDSEVQPFDLPATLGSAQMPRMATLYIGKGKKDKISKGDILGFLCKKGHLNNEDIGRIDVKERYAYVAVSRNKVKRLLADVAGEKIKGVKTIVEEVK
ncbi:DEAD/DEAH box helicase [Hoylesella loescheii]|uniref:DEAD/DEAH box helicase n=1 Tax=Hoylesella loescheii TaxID=840 RepID=UPI0028E24761|nr:DEAD/DEAH box helicase [Hoylesella loescheii]